MLDVISPCVTFNDHEGSTKSYKYMQEHDEPINELGFVPSFEDIEVDYDHGTTLDVRMHDGSSLRLRKIREDYDPTNKTEAVKTLMEAHEKGDVCSPARFLWGHTEADLYRSAEPGRPAAGLRYPIQVIPAFERCAGQR